MTTSVIPSDNPYVNQSAYNTSGLYQPVFEASSTNYRNAHRQAVLGMQMRLQLMNYYSYKVAVDM